MGLNQIVCLAATSTDGGGNFTKALLNTAMGIIIVFIVLFAISEIISLFRYINKWELAKSKKCEVSAAVEPETPASDDFAAGEEELSDDLELVAVITAAIEAYESSKGNDVPANGLVVRSIRRINREQWQSA
ncbi:MAG: hypothetical protein E7256_09685 [Lachnospiraceae bacterium]|nr:hypothetical protein [Lachnospiraceae bacterium]